MTPALDYPLRALYHLPHAVRRRGHINAVDAERTQRMAGAPMVPDSPMPFTPIGLGELLLTVC